MVCVTPKVTAGGGPAPRQPVPLCFIPRGPSPHLLMRNKRSFHLRFSIINAGSVCISKENIYAFIECILGRMEHTD